MISLQKTKNKKTKNETSYLGPILEKRDRSFGILEGPVPEPVQLGIEHRSRKKGGPLQLRSGTPLELLPLTSSSFFLLLSSSSSLFFFFFLFSPFSSFLFCSLLSFFFLQKPQSTQFKQQYKQQPPPQQQLVQNYTVASSSSILRRSRFPLGFSFSISLSLCEWLLVFFVESVGCVSVREVTTETNIQIPAHSLTHQ